MYQAALDTSLTCSLVIARDGEPLLEQTLDSASREHDRRLPPWLLASVASCGITLHDIRQWTVGTGPGSFAGLRSGIAHLMGICTATGAQLRGVPSAIAAAEAAQPTPGQRIGVILDGRCGEVILAIVQDRRLVAPPQAMTPETLTEPDHACDRWLTPQARLLPPLPAPIADSLIAIDAISPSPRLSAPDAWPTTTAEMIASCTPIYVRPPVFVAPLPVNNLLA